jgi:polar amino acid transport system permease protein
VPFFAADFSLAAWWAGAGITRPTVVYLLGGVGMTCLLIVAAMIIGLILGTVMAALQVYGPRWSGRLAGVYVWFFRGVPILLLMFMFFYGLYSQLENLIFHLAGARVRVPAFVSAATVLGLCSAAYQSQIFRGAILSIPAGQFKAALALGFSPARAVTTIILPQALRLSIPAWSNEYSILLKDSAIAYSIGCLEIMARFKSVASTNYRLLLMFIMAGAVYYLLTSAGVRLLGRLYARLRLPGLAEAESSGS